MALSQNILASRKRKGLSQEELGDYVNVTRQTISNWELGETMPNPEQLKLLSKALNISIDKLLDNEVSEELMIKVSNTEKLAGIIIKVLKVLGILFIFYIIFIIVAVISFGIYTFNKPIVQSSATTICSLDNKDYQIEFGTNNYFKCDECSNTMKKELKDLVNFDNMEESLNNIEEYFKINNGYCE